MTPAAPRYICYSVLIKPDEGGRILNLETGKYYFGINKDTEPVTKGELLEILNDRFEFKRLPQGFEII